MRHITDGVLRRLDDEPLAIPDRVIDHVAGCRRCSARRARIAHDTERAPGCCPPRSWHPTRTWRGRGSSASFSSEGARGKPTRRPKRAPSVPAGGPVSEGVTARRAGHRRGRDRDRGHGCGGHAHDHLRAYPRGAGVPEPERPAGDHRVHGPGRQPCARGLLHPERFDHASVRNDQMVLLRHRPSGVVAGRGRPRMPAFRCHCPPTFPRGWALSSGSAFSRA